MYIREVVTQPRNVPQYCTILNKRYVGPLGTARYLLQSEQEIQLDEAYPYKVVVLLPLFESYNIAHFLEMLKFFLLKTINSAPTNFIVNKYASTNTIHIYPMYKDDYLYVCFEEAQLLRLNPINLLGLYPITNDPLCWFYMRIANPIFWNDLCLIRSSEKTSDMIGVNETISESIANRRSGYKPEQDPQVLMYNRM